MWENEDQMWKVERFNAVTAVIQRESLITPNLTNPRVPSVYYLIFCTKYNVCTASCSSLAVYSAGNSSSAFRLNSCTSNLPSKIFFNSSVVTACGGPSRTIGSYSKHSTKPLAVDLNNEQS